ncbi:hypothetical protein V5O48_006955 [Marasmius crinis-equi]|uniref:Uncharacterized protein n=1 Tax=Marasmius crinis-equi TaxID=585013 RepID=A0ABR3FI17_9AGAR
MQLTAKPLALLALVLPAVASPVPGPGFRVYWDDKCGCHVTVTTTTTTTATPTTTPCSTTPTTTPPTTTPSTTTTTTTTPTTTPPPSTTTTPTTIPSSTTTPCTTTTSTTSSRPTTTPVNINTGNHCGQYGTQNNYCFNNGQYNGLSDSCNGGSVYCCQNNPWQNGNFNQNTGNCQTFTVNNYGNSGSGSGSNSNNNSGGSSGGGLLGSLTGKNGLLGSLGLF